MHEPAPAAPQSRFFLSHRGLPFETVIDVVLKDRAGQPKVARLRDGTRKVTHVSEILGFDFDKGTFSIRDLYLRKVDSVDSNGTVHSRLLPTGLLPSKLEYIHAQGYDVPEAMHQAAHARARARS